MAGPSDLISGESYSTQFAVPLQMISIDHAQSWSRDPLAKSKHTEF
jgi:hypothetical protein